MCNIYILKIMSLNITRDLHKVSSVLFLGNYNRSREELAHVR
jgi:hypothetical protein